MIRAAQMLRVKTAELIFFSLVPSAKPSWQSRIRHGRRNACWTLTLSCT